MSNYWINVMATAHSTSSILSIAFGILNLFLIVSCAIGYDLFDEQHFKKIIKVTLGCVIAFIFLILIYIFTSPIN